MKTLMTIFCLFFILHISATIINIPDDQPTIQAGIDVSADGDTVLVQPGTYFENLDFFGKEITVASMLLATQDTAYISQTIIDGNQSGSVVRFENMENNNTALIGFTLTNGFSQDQGGGIHCNYSSPTLDHLKIINNHSESTGGGIYCFHAYPIITNSEILNNYSEYSGGGIACYYSNPTISNSEISNNYNNCNHGSGLLCNNASPVLSNVIISNNSGFSSGSGIYCQDNSNPILQDVVISENANRYAGGGIYISDDSHPTLTNTLITENTTEGRGGGIVCYGQLDLTNVTICNNSAYEGGGIYIDSHDVNFNYEDRCNIYCNHAYFGSDLCGDYYNPVNINVIVDTFTVQNPTTVQVYPLEDFTFDILNGYYPPIYADVYVSPTGDDSNDGLSWNSSLKTITCALTRIQTSITEPHTIYLSSGIFSSETNNEIFPLFCVSNVAILGEGQSETQIIGNVEDYVFRLLEVDNVIMQNVTISSGKQGVHIEDCSDINLESLTICDNYTDDTQDYGGGIHCSSSNSILFNNLMIYNNHAYYGAGIYLGGLTNTIVDNSIIRNNQAESTGGGIYTVAGTFNLMNTQICDNRASAGGGLTCKFNSVVNLDNVSIHNNSGRGICCNGDGIELNFTEDHSCNLYNNYGTVGNDIYSYNAGFFEIIVDTFTVANPTNFHAYPVEEFSFDILHPMLQQENADLYVSPDGNDNNSGLSFDEPLRTIYSAFSKILTDSLNSHTVFLDEGIYCYETNGEVFPVSIVEDYLTLQGDESNHSILQSDNTSILIYIYMANHCNLNDFIMQNGYGGYGGAMRVKYSSISLNRIKAQNNHSSYSGSAIFADNSDLTIKNSCFVNNLSNNHEGVVNTHSGSMNLLNSTITDNDSGEAVAILGGEVLIVNSILREDNPYQVLGEYCNVVVSHSDVLEGEAGITGYETFIAWLDGNIDEDPLFNWNYYLPENSPCVDAGTSYFEWNSEILLDMQPDEYYGSAPDMGAYEFGFVAVNDNTIIPDRKCVLHQNYPNPFNPVTNIVFNLPEESSVQLEIYNIKGQKTKSLLSDQIKAGEHSIIWDGKDASGKRISSGVYLYKLKVNGKTEAVRKCLLLK
ncbi:MAG: right-handed parallel beta-helix repeat-containing protein [Armatimonadetes bacterium]|nr:right-handed parallel beta-helix repeat-containing protein [Armatimonadota bacterium]